MEAIPYKSYCWSLGTTSFRTRNFNRTIEEQLALLDRFWAEGENADQPWSGDVQTRYYRFMQRQGFVDGSAARPDKDARQKTSGLRDFGLVDDARRLTPVGRALLEISEAGDFSPDNLLQIPRDSFLYLGQLLKTSVKVNGQPVRPFLVLLRLLSRLGYLTWEEFACLLPLCVSPETTEAVTAGIAACRRGETTTDALLLAHLLQLENYQAALAALLTAPEVTAEMICTVGLNRKSRRYDRPYYPLYQALHRAILEGDATALPAVYSAARDIAIGELWRGYLFDTSSETAIQKDPAAHRNHPTLFDGAVTEADFRTAFFKVMHLLKARATLSDYADLNRRYFRTSDVVCFADGRVELDIVPRHFFTSVADTLYADAFRAFSRLGEACALPEISPCLTISEAAVIAGVNAELGTAVTTMEEARQVLEQNRYTRLHALLDARFTRRHLLALLEDFETRNDPRIREMVTDNADVPTIFEYVLGLLWYQLSGRRGKILTYMKLSLDADLLPKTHAAGGEADIVYEYDATAAYPAHTLLLEATLADRTNQRRMEMEPVSRHLGQHLLRRGGAAYCVFVTTNLNINVIADFRGRKTMYYYDVNDLSRFVEGMKIIPLDTGVLKALLRRGVSYEEIYQKLDTAFRSALPPAEWYRDCIQAAF